MSKHTVSIESKLESMLEKFFGDEESGEINFEAALTCAVNRKAALAKHSGKVSKVKRAISDGKAIPKGVTFKRYVPTFLQAKLDHQDTSKEVARWAHNAPSDAPASPAALRKTVQKAARKASRKIAKRAKEHKTGTAMKAAELKAVESI